MNILMVNYEYPPVGGGGGVVHEYLATELARKNYVAVVTSKFNGQKSYSVRNNVEIFRVPIIWRKDRNAATILSMLSFLPSSLCTIYRLLKKRRFDIIHSMFAIPSAPSGLLLAKKFGIPHVVSILGGDVYDPTKRLSPHRISLLRFVVRKVLEESDLIVGMSTDIIERVQAHYGISKEITLIPHAIERPVFNKKRRQDFGYESDAILLVTVGRLVPRKQVDELLQLTKLLGQNVKLIVIGDGPEKQNLQDLANTLEISEAVHFVGNVDNETKFQLLTIADIYVSSTSHEGFGLVFLEAMAAGLPIVSYDNGGHMDFLSDGKTGFLVRLGNLKVFSEQIELLCRDPGIRRHMGAFNKRYVEKFYIENCAKRYETVYKPLGAPRLGPIAAGQGTGSSNWTGQDRIFQAPPASRVSRSRD